MSNNDESRWDAFVEYWTPERLVKTVSWCICFIGIIVCAICVMKTINKTNVYNADIQSMSSDIKTFQANLATLTDAVPEDTSNSALTVGNEVATIQNKYIELKTYVTDDSTESLMSKMADNDTQLADYFSDSKSIGDWYLGVHVNCSWTFNTTYSFFEDGASVIWLCQEKDTLNILAYATAKYDAISNKFSNLNVYVTNIGQLYVDDISETEVN